ncbi:hypothetical protein [Bradyrhizobium zhanjiangense]|nr:hypothetical protein [Bradyrhizobium zhanjiangense]
MNTLAVCSFGIGAAILFPESAAGGGRMSTSPYVEEPAFHRPVIELV